MIAVASMRAYASTLKTNVDADTPCDGGILPTWGELM